MQSTLTPDYLLDSMPFFGDEPVAIPDLPLPRAAITLPLGPAAPEPVAVLKALRIVRAKTGETEMRLFESKAEGQATAYVVRMSSLNPTNHDDKVLQKGHKLMNEAQARATFERLVTGHYPAVVLRKDMHVPIHLDLL